MLGHIWLFVTMDWNPPGSSVHGILQARILKWVAILFSRGSSRLRDWTLSLSCCRQILYHLSHQGRLNSPVDVNLNCLKRGSCNRGPKTEDLRLGLLGGGAWGGLQHLGTVLPGCTHSWEPTPRGSRPGLQGSTPASGQGVWKLIARIHTGWCVRKSLPSLPPEINMCIEIIWVNTCEALRTLQGTQSAFKYNKNLNNK